GGRKRQHLIGTVDPLDGRVTVAFSEGLKSVQFQQYLEALLSRHPPDKKLLLVLDNARAHHAKALTPFLEANERRLELIFLPPYSPDMNPMEWFWKFLRKNVTHDTFFSTFKEFQRVTFKFIRKYKHTSTEIKTRCKFTKLFSAP
ncbi:MAG: IS630 family transposase, partial [Promethearchaeota archaeon]